MACARILLVFGCFGTGPAGVRVFRNRTKALFFMGSKGDVKEFFGMRFAWRVLLVFGCCCCSSVRMGFSTAPLARSLLVLEAAKGAGQ